MRIVIAQLNLLVGDIQGNTKKIINATREACDKYSADVIVFPELSITSYPPEDLLYRPALYPAIDSALDEISKHSYDIDLIIGYPEKIDNKLFNTCAHVSAGEIQNRYHKQELPNYSVFDEKRYFQPGSECCVFDLKGVPVALSICEDIWGKSVCSQAREAGARLIFNINASPYHTNKIELRKQVLSQRVKESGLGIIYTNLIGGQDELVFDGASMAMDSSGNLCLLAPEFEEGLFVVEYSNGNMTSRESNAGKMLEKHEAIYKALILGVRDYAHKNGFDGAIIGLSGGIDSALTLCIAVDALGAENVMPVIMPSRYTLSMSVEDATKMCQMLGVKYQTVSIEPPFKAFTSQLEPVFDGYTKSNATEENIQARCRGIILMAISNKTGKLVLTTGNKSEMSVGYATLYGDMAGGFAPLKDIPKTMVYELSNWRNSVSKMIPQRIIERPPSAELRENQLDQDALPPYEILDPILERYIEQDQSPDEIVGAGFDSKIVEKVVKMVDRNEYKRRQVAPGVRISQRAFGRDRRYPITSGYRE